MTNAGERMVAAIQPEVLAGQLGVDPAVVADALATEPGVLADGVTDVYVEEETRNGNVYHSADVATGLEVIAGADWSQAPPENRAATAVYCLHILAKLGITNFDMGAAN